MPKRTTRSPRKRKSHRTTAVATTRAASRSLRHPASGTVVEALRHLGERMLADHGPMGPRRLHVYVSPLVQEHAGMDHVLWEAEPIVAWDDNAALQEAERQLAKLRLPIPVTDDPPPHFVLRRIEGRALN